MKRLLPGIVVILALVAFGWWRGRPVAVPAIFDTRPLAQVQGEAEAQGKPLIIKATASWCPPCKEMDRTTFSDAGVVDAIRAAGLAAHMDIDEHQEAARAWGIEGVPTTLVFLNGRELARAEGYMPPEQFKAWLAAALAAR
jgi:thioredoxin-like negative regulator of GroEL